jgi:SAM-dependent methyltransferase
MFRLLHLLQKRKTFAQRNCNFFTKSVDCPFARMRAALCSLGNASFSAKSVLLTQRAGIHMSHNLWRRELEFYKGMIVGCAPGTHAAAVSLIAKHLKGCSGVIDLGARSGSLLAQLREVGFSDLNAIDLDVKEMKLPDVPVRRIDLNTDFADHYDRKFKLLCCSDVLEHLNSPRHFFQQAHRLLEDDGYLCVTVPNIAFWHGRIKFVLKGEHWGFGEWNYRQQRHISPMTFDAMRMTMAENGFHLVDAVTAGSFAGPVQKIALAPLAAAFRLIGGKRALGETSIYLAQRTAPDVVLTHPTHYSSWERESMPIERLGNDEGIPVMG